MGGSPDESRLAVGNKEDKEMFEKEIDEIYGLCKRVVNEVPTASVTFTYWIYGVSVCGSKGRKILISPKTCLSGICTKTYLLTHFIRTQVARALE